MINILYQIFEQVQKRKEEGKPIIELNVGEPDQKPPQKVLKVINQSLINGQTQYGSAAGDFELRETIAEKYQVSLDNVVIGPGSKFLIYAFLKTILTKKDEEIIIPTPVWGTYALMIENIGLGKIRFFETRFEENWQIDLKKLEQLINKKTKLMIICDPNNPTSTKLESKLKSEIINMACKHNLKIIFDNAYEGLAFEKQEQINNKNLKNIIQIFSFSKTYAMTGFRLGYALANKKIIQQVIKFNQITITCVPQFIQRGGLAALKEKGNFAQELVSIYRKRAQLATKILTQAGLKFVSPQAGFYLFVKFPKITTENFCLELLEKGVALVPGTAFGSFPEFIRISLTVPEKQLLRGLNILVDEYQQKIYA